MTCFNKNIIREENLYSSPVVNVINIPVEKGFCESYGVDPMPWGYGLEDLNNN